MSLTAKTARYVIVCAALVGHVVLGQAAGRTSSAGPGAQVCMSILVPSYFYPSPGGSGWDTLLASKATSQQADRVLIVNPASGPGSAANADFQKIVVEAHKKGQKIYGYVPTGYGKDPMPSVQNQVRKYVSWYGVDGIFVDEVAAEADKISPYYQPLATFITSAIKGGGVILNNGTYPDAAYAAITVPAKSKLQLVVFEHDYAHFTDSAFTVPQWIRDHPASMFVNIVYEVPSEQWPNVLRLSAERNVGSVYVTDLTLPNPYKALPSYWSGLDRATEAGCKR